MQEKILFVDDELPILEGYKRSLYRDYEVHTALGGAAGLAAIRDKGPFSVVVTDMRMPGMNGAEFLVVVRSIAPHTARVLLTGYSDLNEVTAAVNQGNILRYLNKPCSKEDLAGALQNGVFHYRTALAEKELLESTLLHSIRALVEVLGAVNPAAFERSLRMSGYVRHLLKGVLISVPWRVEAAAMLSQIGCLALSPELLRAAHLGQKLDPVEQARFDVHPQQTRELVGHIPRMDWVAWLVERQIFSPNVTTPPEATPQEAQELVLGGEMLRLAVAYDTLWLKGLRHAEMVQQLRAALPALPRPLLDALETMAPVENLLKPATLPVSKVRVDMIIDRDLFNKSGALLVGGGQPINRALLMKLQAYVENGVMHNEIRVLVPSASEG